jgi:hypothetical protein
VWKEKEAPIVQPTGRPRRSGALTHVASFRRAATTVKTAIFTFRSGFLCRKTTLLRFIIDVHKHLYHTQKFNSGVAETDIALRFLDA